jgi:hypothetical protein
MPRERQHPIIRELAEAFIPAHQRQVGRRDQFLQQTMLGVMQGQLEALSQANDIPRMKAAVKDINAQYKKIAQEFGVGLPKGMDDLIAPDMLHRMENRLVEGKAIQGDVSRLVADLWIDIFDQEIEPMEAVTRLRDNFEANKFLSTQHPEQLPAIIEVGEAALREEQARLFAGQQASSNASKTALSHMGGMLPILMSSMPDVAKLYQGYMDTLEHRAYVEVARQFDAVEGEDKVNGERLEVSVGNFLGIRSLEGDGMNQIHSYIREERGRMLHFLRRKMDQEVDFLINTTAQEVRAKAQVATIPAAALGETELESLILKKVEDGLTNFVRSGTDLQLEEKEGLREAVRAMAREGFFGIEFSRLEDIDLDALLDEGMFDEGLERTVPGQNFKYEDVLREGETIYGNGTDFMRALTLEQLNDGDLMGRIYAIRQTTDLETMHQITGQLLEEGATDGVISLINEVVPGFNPVIYQAIKDGTFHPNLFKPAEDEPDAKKEEKKQDKAEKGIQQTPAGAGTISPRASATPQTVDDLKESIRAAGPEKIQKQLSARRLRGNPAADPGYLKEVQEVTTAMKEELELPTAEELDQMALEENATISAVIQEQTAMAMERLNIQPEIITEDQVAALTERMEAQFASAETPGARGGPMRRAADLKLFEDDAMREVGRQRGVIPPPGQKLKEIGERKTTIPNLQPVPVDEPSLAVQPVGLEPVGTAPRPLDEAIQTALQAIPENLPTRV